jgi:hypothetical protein
MKGPQSEGHDPLRSEEFWYTPDFVDVIVTRDTVYRWTCLRCETHNTTMVDPSIYGQRYCTNCGKEVRFRQ